MGGGIWIDMDGWVGEWMDDYMDIWIIGYMDIWMDGWMVEWVGGLVNAYIKIKNIQYFFTCPKKWKMNLLIMFTTWNNILYLTKLYLNICFFPIFTC